MDIREDLASTRTNTPHHILCSYPRPIVHTTHFTRRWDVERPQDARRAIRQRTQPPKHLCAGAATTNFFIDTSAP